MVGETGRAGGDTGPDTVEAAIAVLLGAGVVAWRFLDWVATPARSAAMTLLSTVVGPVATGPTADHGRVLRAQLTRLTVRALRCVARQVLDAVLPALDITEMVLALARVDLDAIVRRIDLVGIAQSVIDAIDLPEIVRDSTGALSSDAVRAVREQGRQADDKVAGLVDRLLRRSAARAPVMP